MNKAKTLIIILSSILFASCTKGVIFSEFKDVSPIAWDKDSAVTFSFHIADTLHPCNVLLHLRHQDNYPYQNMWFFLTSISPDGISKSDTIEFFLADDRGRWLGNGRNGHISMPVLYEQNYLFPDTGIYSLSIRHGMRTGQLRGVTQVGLELQHP